MPNKVKLAWLVIGLAILGLLVMLGLAGGFAVLVGFIIACFIVGILVWAYNTLVEYWFEH